MIDIELAADSLDSAATYLSEEHVTPCDESMAVSESLAILGQRMRYDVRNMQNALVTLFEMLSHLDSEALDDALAEMDLSEHGFEEEMATAKAAIGWQAISPDDDEQGDDLCDTCMRSGVVVYRTDENGKTVCVDCDKHADE